MNFSDKIKDVVITWTMYARLIEAFFNVLEKISKAADAAVQQLV